MLKNNYDDNPNMFRLKISQNVFVLKGHVFVRICAICLVRVSIVRHMHTHTCICVGKRALAV